MEGASLSSSRDNLKDLLTKEPPQPEWLVPNLIVKGSMVALCGLPGVGKSVFAYTLSLALGSGIQFFGRDTIPSKILYLDEENGHRDRRAYIYRAWCGLGKPDIDGLDQRVAIHGFALTTSPLAWDACLAGLAAEVKPDLIVIDTATPALRIEDENSNGEASRAARKLRGIMDSVGPDCSMILMKHLRVDHKTGKVDMRGAKFWKGTVDATWYQTRLPGRPRNDGTHRTVLRPTKLRAFGLRNKIEIDAIPTDCGNGVILQGVDKPFSREDEELD